jgi:hypothetical protein
VLPEAALEQLKTPLDVVRARVDQRERLVELVAHPDGVAADG